APGLGPWRLCGHPGSEQGQIKKLAALQRQVLNLLRLNGVADIRLFGFYQWYFRFHLNCFSDTPRIERHIKVRFHADNYGYVVLDCPAKTFHLDGQVVSGRFERQEFIKASVLVLVARVASVRTSRIVTWAPGITAPVLSVTVPEIVPLCPKAMGANAK